MIVVFFGIAQIPKNDKKKKTQKTVTSKTIKKII